MPKTNNDYPGSCRTVLPVAELSILFALSGMRGDAWGPSLFGPDGSFEDLYTSF